MKSGHNVPHKSTKWLESLKDSGNKWCPRCKQIKRLDDFNTNCSNKDQLSCWCSQCCSEASKEYRSTEKHRMASRKRMLRFKYDITVAQWNELHTSQGGKCQICKEILPEITASEKIPAVDHCHKTGKIRGLLCHPCNAGLGHFKDSIELLQKAINYLNECS